MSPDVPGFYNKFSEFQQKIAFNERHFLMLDKLLELGLARDSSVLELGCGIGIISSLISRVVKRGRLTAVDISPKSIEIARERNRNKNATFEAADIVTYEPGKGDYDFVTLFDVLEHVPVESHRALFERFAACMSETGKFVVNIPNPEFLRFLHHKYPDKVQIIDQPLSIPRLISELDQSGLVLRSLRTYDLWHKNESMFMWFERIAPFVEKETPPPRQTLLRKFQNRFEVYW